MFFGKYFVFLCVTVVIQVCSSTEDTFEAAFQGQCEQHSPCQHLCYDLHDGTYECACRQGFTLSTNGYGCLEVQENDTMDDMRIEVRVAGVQDYRLSQYDTLDASTPRVQYPRLKPDGYLLLPSLASGRSSLQLSVQFRPDALTGVLLHCGENADLGGDYIALLLVDGYVEFRFDCGLGEGVVRSRQPVGLNEWNVLTLYRDGWDSWMKLNDQPQEEGRARNLYSRITFRQPLVLGSLRAARLSHLPSFSGCVRSLEVNNYRYEFTSDSSQGYHIEECAADACNRVGCQNGGKCVARGPDEGMCLCPLGFVGEACQTAMEMIIPAFNGSSYLLFPGLGSSVLSFLELKLILKPNNIDGLILYNGYKLDISGDFISLALIGGYVEFRFDLGSGQTTLRSKDPITVNEWHTIFISRTGRDGLLQVDMQESVEGMAPGGFTQLSLPLNLYLGGFPELWKISRLTGVKQNFIGCVQKMVVNSKTIKLVEEALSGVNVENCEHGCALKPCKNGGSCEPKLDYYTCHCQLSYTGPKCNQVMTDLIYEPMFAGASYLFYSDDLILKRVCGNKMDMKLRFRSFAPTGVLLWADSKTDFMALGLKHGWLQFQFNLGSGETTLVHNMTRLDDGRWHTVKIRRTSQKASLQVDNGLIIVGASPGPMTQLNVHRGLYLGGLHDATHQSNGRYTSGLVGCIANLTLATDYHVHLLSEAKSGVNMQPCL